MCFKLLMIEAVWSDAGNHMMSPICVIIRMVQAQVILPKQVQQN